MLALLLPITCGPNGIESYDEACERIVAHAQSAARVHNSGDEAAAQREADAAAVAYHAAVALEPKEPQAYLHGGQAFYNMQRFDESIAAFEAALGVLPSGGQFQTHVALRLRAAQLGKASKARDAVYADGQGNLTAALQLIRQQLELQPKNPRYLFDAATLQAVRSGVEAGAEAEALSLFAAAQAATAPAAAAFMRRERVSSHLGLKRRTSSGTLHLRLP